MIDLGEKIESQTVISSNSAQNNGDKLHVSSSLWWLGQAQKYHWPPQSLVINQFELEL